MKGRRQVFCEEGDHARQVGRLLLYATRVAEPIQDPQLGAVLVRGSEQSVRVVDGARRRKFQRVLWIEGELRG